jgi:GNAT superfamily N-acetyltransferase
MTQVETQTERPAPMPVNVRKTTADDRTKLVAAMARAFDDDPVANWFAKQDARRARRIYDFMDVGLKITERHDEVYTTDDIDGGAFWSPPGKWKMGILQQLMLMPAMIRTCTLRRVPTVMGGLNAIEKKHPHKEHYYLLALGVEPDRQGRSIGTQLMRPILERCDREGIPAYLESSKDVNVPLYERNGFKVTEEMAVPNGGPKVWLMWRDPQ